MAIFPLPPGLIARLNVPPIYKAATGDTAPPAYIVPLNRTSTFRPESIPLPPSPSPAPAPAPAPAPSTSTQQIPPPEYSPSVYSQQQHLSHYLPNPDPDLDPADLGFPSSPRRPSASKVEHASHFKERRTDLSMRVDLEANQEGGVKGDGGQRPKSVFWLDAQVKEREVERERRLWKRGALAMGVGVLVVVVVAVVVGLGVYERRRS